MPARGYQDYIETALEPLDWGGSGLGLSYFDYVAPGNPFTVGRFLSPVDEPPLFAPARPIVPPILFPTPATIPKPSVVEAAGDTAVPVQEVAPVIDPEYLPTTTVFEDAPGGIYETKRAETDWDAVYDQYVILNAEEDVPIHGSTDWGDVFSRAAGAAVGGILDPFGAGRATTSFFSPQQALVASPAGVSAPSGGSMQTPVVGGAGCPPNAPRYLKYCVATGEYSPLRRRRRRRLLTSSDIKDLSALKSIVGGAALQGAVVQAVRR